MTEPSTIAPPNPAEFSYGNQAERLEEFRSWDYDTFKQLLFETHNGHPDIEVEDSFVAKQNGTMGGYLYPRPEDKDNLLEYALQEAQKQDDIQVAALIIGTAVVVTHPFWDGNGRTARTLYSYLSRGLDDTNPEHSLVRKGGMGDVIDFEAVHKNAYNLDEHIIYHEQGLPKIAGSIWFLSRDSEIAKHHYGDREFAGLTETERAELDALLGEKHGEEGEEVGRYSGGNTDAQVYAFSKLAAVDHLELPIDKYPTHTAVNIPDALANMSASDKRKFMEYFQEYISLRAKADIDLWGKYGDNLFRTKNGELSIRDYLIQTTNNYLASKVGKRVLHS